MQNGRYVWLVSVVAILLGIFSLSYAVDETGQDTVTTNGILTNTQSLSTGETISFEGLSEDDRNQKQFISNYELRNGLLSRVEYSVFVGDTVLVDPHLEQWFANNPTDDEIREFGPEGEAACSEEFYNESACTQAIEDAYGPKCVTDRYIVFAIFADTSNHIAWKSYVDNVEANTANGVVITDPIYADTLGTIYCPGVNTNFCTGTNGQEVNEPWDVIAECSDGTTPAIRPVSINGRIVQRWDCGINVCETTINPDTADKCAGTNGQSGILNSEVVVACDPDTATPTNINQTTDYTTWTCEQELCWTDTGAKNAPFCAGTNGETVLRTNLDTTCSNGSTGVIYEETSDLVQWSCGIHTCSSQITLCGNGLPDPGEQCDQGGANGAPNSTCTAVCTELMCGDQVVTAPEACDNGVVNGQPDWIQHLFGFAQACSATCTNGNILPPGPPGPPPAGVCVQEKDVTDAATDLPNPCGYDVGDPVIMEMEIPGGVGCANMALEMHDDLGGGAIGIGGIGNCDDSGGFSDGSIIPHPVKAPVTVFDGVKIGEAIPNALGLGSVKWNCFETVTAARQDQTLFVAHALTTVTKDWDPGPGVNIDTGDTNSVSLGPIIKSNIVDFKEKDKIDLVVDVKILPFSWFEEGCNIDHDITVKLDMTLPANSTVENIFVTTNDITASIPALQTALRDAFQAKTGGSHEFTKADPAINIDGVIPDPYEAITVTVAAEQQKQNPGGPVFFCGKQPISDTEDIVRIPCPTGPCAALAAPDYGSKNPDAQQVFQPGESISFSCDSGRTLVGSATSYCQGSHVDDWSSPTPTCKPEECVDGQEFDSEGNPCPTTCPDGRTVDDPEECGCPWPTVNNVNTLPAGEVTIVGNPSGWVGGPLAFNILGGFHQAGDVATIKCNDDESITTTTTCGSDDTWSDTSISCDGSVTPVCGNSTVEAGEQCDDGNTISGDGCSASCQTESDDPTCNNGVLDNDPYEECEPYTLPNGEANPVGNDYCTASCICESGYKEDPDNRGECIQDDGANLEVTHTASVGGSSTTFNTNDVNTLFASIAPTVSARPNIIYSALLATGSGASLPNCSDIVGEDISFEIEMENTERQTLFITKIVSNEYDKGSRDYQDPNIIDSQPLELEGGITAVESFTQTYNGNAKNTLTVFYQTEDGAKHEEDAEVDICVQGTSGATLTKEVEGDPKCESGETLSFLITFTNNGTVPLKITDFEDYLYETCGKEFSEYAIDADAGSWMIAIGEPTYEDGAIVVAPGASEKFRCSTPYNGNKENEITGYYTDDTHNYSVTGSVNFCDSTPPSTNPLCGNSVVDAGEECDGAIYCIDPGEPLECTCLDEYQIDRVYNPATGACEQNFCGDLTKRWDEECDDTSDSCVVPRPNEDHADNTCLCNVSEGWEYNSSNDRCEQSGGGGWGGWSSTCDTVPTVANATAGAPTGTAENDTVTYTCDSGYVLSTSSDTKTCRTDAGGLSWQDDVECVITCSDLSDPSNGSVTHNGQSGGDTTNEAGDTATYSCDSGYVLIGTSTRTCATDGNFDGSAATCEPVPTITKTLTSSTPLKEGDTATWQIQASNPSSVTVNNFAITDSLSGASCTGEPSGTTTIAAGGSITPFNCTITVGKTELENCAEITGGTIGGVTIPSGIEDCDSTGAIEYCGNGTVETGETCDDGNNDNDDGCSAVCALETCDSPPSAPSDSSITATDDTIAGPTNETNPGDTVTYDCDSGFTGWPETITCASDGTWPAPSLTCTPGTPSDLFIEGTELDYEEAVNVGSTVTTTNGGNPGTLAPKKAELDDPNFSGDPDTSFFSYAKGMTEQLQRVGGVYSGVVRDYRSQTIGILPIMPATASVKRRAQRYDFSAIPVGENIYMEMEATLSGVSSAITPYDLSDADQVTQDREFIVNPEAHEVVILYREGSLPATTNRLYDLNNWTVLTRYTPTKYAHTIDLTGLPRSANVWIMPVVSWDYDDTMSNIDSYNDSTQIARLLNRRVFRANGSATQDLGAGVIGSIPGGEIPGFSSVGGTEDPDLILFKHSMSIAAINPFGPSNENRNGRRRKRVYVDGPGGSSLGTFNPSTDRAFGEYMDVLESGASSTIATFKGSFDGTNTYRFEGILANYQSGCLIGNDFCNDGQFQMIVGRGAQRLDLTKVPTDAQIRMQVPNMNLYAGRTDWHLYFIKSADFEDNGFWDYSVARKLRSLSGWTRAGHVRYPGDYDASFLPRTDILVMLIPDTQLTRSVAELDIPSSVDSIGVGAPIVTANAGANFRAFIGGTPGTASCTNPTITNSTNPGGTTPHGSKYVAQCTSGYMKVGADGTCTDGSFNGQPTCEDISAAGSGTILAATGRVSGNNNFTAANTAMLSAGIEKSFTGSAVTYDSTRNESVVSVASYLYDFPIGTVAATVEIDYENNTNTPVTFDLKYSTTPPTSGSDFSSWTDITSEVVAANSSGSSSIDIGSILPQVGEVYFAYVPTVPAALADTEEEKKGFFAWLDSLIPTIKAAFGDPRVEVEITVVTSSDVTCAHPGNPTGGTTTPSTGPIPTGQSVTFACNAGFDVAPGGNTEFTCDATGTWIGDVTGDDTLPTCVPRCTTQPPNAGDGSGGSVGILAGEVQADYTQGTVVNYDCPTGLAATNTCTTGGAWQKSSPECLDPNAAQTFDFIVSGLGGYADPTGIDVIANGVTVISLSGATLVDGTTQFSYSVTDPNDCVTVSPSGGGGYYYYGGTVAWEIQDDLGNTIALGGTSGDATYCSPVLLKSSCAGELHTFTIYDSYGDGIFSPGGYELSTNGNLAFSVFDGASFSDISIQFCYDTVSANSCFDTEITTDFYPSETTWDIRNASSTVIRSGGPYSNSGATEVDNYCP